MLKSILHQISTNYILDIRRRCKYGMQVSRFTPDQTLLFNLNTSRTDAHMLQIFYKQFYPSTYGFDEVFLSSGQNKHTAQICLNVAGFHCEVIINTLAVYSLHYLEIIHFR